jgi:hypothetical protein
VLISPEPDLTEKKKQLKGRHFSSEAEVIAVADGQPSDFFLKWLAKVRIWSL